MTDVYRYEAEVKTLLLVYTVRKESTSLHVKTSDVGQARKRMTLMSLPLSYCGAADRGGVESEHIAYLNSVSCSMIDHYADQVDAGDSSMT
jgi:hypothetical protein